MNQESIRSQLLESAGLGNKDAHRVSRIIWSSVLQYVKEEKKKVKTEVKVDSTASDLQKFLDSPMSDEERSRHVRAAMDSELSKGASIQDLERVAKTFGLGKGEDTEITTVDFSEAFPDIHVAKEVALKMVEEQMK